MDRRQAVAAALFGLALILVASALLLKRSPERRREALHRSTYEPDPVEPASEPGPSSLYQASRQAPGLTLEEFLATLEQDAGPPVASRVSQAFLSENPLAEYWRTFVNVSGRKAPAAEFVKGVERIPEFRKLAAKLRADAGVQEALAKSASRASIREALGQAGSSGARAAAAADSRVAVRSVNGKLLLSRDPKAGKLKLAFGAGVAFPGFTDLKSLALWASRSEGNTVEDLKNIGRAGPNAHHVDRLASIRSAESAPMQKILERYPWLAQLSAGERDAVVAGIDRFGIWGACFQAGAYARCASACAGSGTCVAPAGGGWSACLDYLESEARCRAECPLQPGCVAPSPALAAAGPAGSPSASPGSAAVSGAEPSDQPDPPDRPATPATAPADTIRMYGVDGTVYDIPLSVISMEGLTMDGLSGFAVEPNTPVPPTDVNFGNY